MLNFRTVYYDYKNNRFSADAVNPSSYLIKDYEALSISDCPDFSPEDVMALFLDLGLRDALSVTTARTSPNTLLDTQHATITLTQYYLVDGKPRPIGRIVKMPNDYELKIAKDHMDRMAVFPVFRDCDPLRLYYQ